MARLRHDYENSWWPRLTRWIKGGSTELDDQMQREYDASREGHLVGSIEEAQAQEEARDERVRQALQDEQVLYEQTHRWAKTKGQKWMRHLYHLVAVVICLSIIWMLLTTASNLPPFGNPNNPVNNEVSQRYIENGMQETGAVNIVAGMILDYRAFDTLGESNVLFIAACSVLILLRISKEKNGGPSAEQLAVEANDRMYEPKNGTSPPAAASPAAR